MYRSPQIVVLFLILTQNYSIDEAISLVKSRHRFARPNMKIVHHALSLFKNNEFNLVEENFWLLFYLCLLVVTLIYNLIYIYESQSKVTLNSRDFIIKLSINLQRTMPSFQKTKETKMKEMLKRFQFNPQLQTSRQPSTAIAKQKVSEIIIRD